MPKMCLIPLMWKASSLLMSESLRYNVSSPYTSWEITTALYTWSFHLLLALVFFEEHFSKWNQDEGP